MKRSWRRSLDHCAGCLSADKVRVAELQPRPRKAGVEPTLTLPASRLRASCFGRLCFCSVDRRASCYVLRVSPEIGSKRCPRECPIVHEPPSENTGDELTTLAKTIYQPTYSTRKVNCSNPETLNPTFYAKLQSQCSYTVYEFRYPSQIHLSPFHFARPSIIRKSDVV